MENWIKNTGYFLLAFGIFGVIKNYKWVTIEERVSLIIATIFILISLIIEFFSWKNRNLPISS